MLYKACWLTEKKWLILILVLMVIQMRFGMCQIQISVQPKRPTVGGNVTFVVKASQDIYAINWYRGDNTFYENNIVTYDLKPKSKPETYDEYTGRETVKDDGSLVITNLLMNYSGKYTLQLTYPESLVHDTITLTVYQAEATPTPSKAATSTSVDATDGEVYSTTADNEVNKESRATLRVGVVIGLVVGIITGCILAGVLLFMGIRRRGRKHFQEPVYEDIVNPYERQQRGGLPHPTVPIYYNSSVYQNDTDGNHKHQYANEAERSPESQYTELTKTDQTSVYLDLHRSDN
ncbi:carcinoembryonic antigen-related cell adhesion molecule 3-like [Hyperolius riggenbachi]|uniref:carcinoembryonic antigen-related cell adhesion molecule 3-like n=1 Tax=Hyperolius riggenbachi TaxID=752182 RepID=UPI0035A2ADAC